VHRCGCSFEKTRVEVRPEQRGTVYFLVQPRCVEKHVELVFEERRTDGPTGE
jgi:hypothetical protein